MNDEIKEEVDLVILDDEKPLNENDNPNSTPIIFDENLMDEEEIQKRAVNSLRYAKASETRKSNNTYKKSISKALRALAQGTFCTLTDGTELTGADIIAMNLFERAMNSDKSAKLLMEATGDLNTNEEKNDTSYENFLDNVKVKL